MTTGCGNLDTRILLVDDVADARFMPFDLILPGVATHGIETFAVMRQWQASR